MQEVMQSRHHALYAVGFQLYECRFSTLLLDTHTYLKCDSYCIVENRSSV